MDLKSKLDIIQLYRRTVAEHERRIRKEQEKLAKVTGRLAILEEIFALEISSSDINLNQADWVIEQQAIQSYCKTEGIVQ